MMYILSARFQLENCNAPARLDSEHFQPGSAQLGKFQLELITSKQVQRVPALLGFWDFKRTALRKICVSGTVGGPLITRKSPTCAYIGQNRSRGPH